MTGLIDADGLVYVIAWNHREHDDVVEVKNTCDDFIRTILATVQATSYIGSFSSKENFRHRGYLYAPYKGLRPEKPEWFTRWEPVIKDHYCDRWGFLVPEDLEADDIIAAAAEVFRSESRPCVVCSPDKDLRQISGYHFDYKKQEFGIVRVEADEAVLNMARQLLTGDTSDNIKGVTGMGPVKADKFLKTIENPEIMLYHAIKGQYRKAFGEKYGEEIYQQTFNSIQLMCSAHVYWPQYQEKIHQAIQNHLKEFDPTDTCSDFTMAFNPFGGL